MTDRSKTALLLAHSFPPISAAGVFRILRFFKYLPEFGWTPLVIAGLPRDADVRRDESLLAGVPGTIRVERRDLYDPEAWFGKLLAAWGWRADGRGPNGDVVPASTEAKIAGGPGSGGGLGALVMKLRELIFRTPDDYVWWVGPAVRAGLRAIRQTNPSVIYSTGPPHSTHLAGLILRLATGLPWVVDFRDPWSRQPWGRKRNFWGAQLLPFFEAECVRQASCVILNTNRMAHDFRNHYLHVRKSKFIALPNGFDPELKTVVEDCVRLRSNGKSSAMLRLCHPGTLYGRRDVRPLIDAIRLLADADISVRFENFGDCPMKAEFEAYVEELGLTHLIRFDPPVSHPEALKRMAEADVLVLIQPNNDMQVPGKLYEMMLFGKPILSLTDEGEVTDIVNRYDLGDVAHSHDAQDIARGIRRLADRLRASGKHVANTAALEAFDGRLLTGRLAETFDDVVRDFGRAGFPQPALPRSAACDRNGSDSTVIGGRSCLPYSRVLPVEAN